MKKFVTSLAAVTLAASLFAGASAVFAADNDTTNGDLPPGFVIPNGGQEFYNIPGNDHATKEEYDKYVAEQKAKEAAANQNKPAKEGETQSGDLPEGFKENLGNKADGKVDMKEDKEEKKADKATAEKVLPKTSAVK